MIHSKTFLFGGAYPHPVPQSQQKADGSPSVRNPLLHHGVSWRTEQALEPSLGAGWRWRRRMVQAHWRTHWRLTMRKVIWTVEGCSLLWLRQLDGFAMLLVAFLANQLDLRSTRDACPCSNAGVCTDLLLLQQRHPTHVIYFFDTDGGTTRRALTSTHSTMSVILRASPPSLSV